MIRPEYTKAQLDVVRQAIVHYEMYLSTLHQPSKEERRDLRILHRAAKATDEAVVKWARSILR